MIWMPHRVAEGRAPGWGFFDAAQGKYSQLCLDLDGVDDYVSMGDVLGKERTDAFSYECWMKFHAAITTSDLFDKQEAAGNKRGISLIASINRVYFYMTNTDGADEIMIRSTWAPVADTWYHIAVTYDGSGDEAGCTIYVDGYHIAHVVVSNTLTATVVNTEPFCIGGPNFPCFGRIDNAAVWNKELSAAEVAESWNSDNLLNHSAVANLEGYWKMGDGDTYPTITDHGSGGNDGTMTNMTASDIVADSPG